MIFKSFQRGALLIAAIVLVVIIAALVTAMSFLTVSNTGASGSHMSSAQAFFVANSGLERALFQYSKLDTACASLTNTNLAVGSGTFSTTGTVYPTAANSTLPVAITISATVIRVASLTGYAPHGRILIENEEIDYAGTSTSAADCGTAPCFVGSKRGANGTVAAAHGSGVAVYQPGQCLIRSTGTAGSAKRVVEAVARELSVQSGSYLFTPSPVAFASTTTVNITPVNPNRSFVVCQSLTGDSHDMARATCDLTSPATLVITIGGKSGDATNSTVTIRWYIVEFMSGVSVQRGLQSLVTATTTADVAINAVTLANTFVINSERINEDSDNGDERWTTSACFGTGANCVTPSTTNLQLRKNGVVATVTVAWQVIQMTSSGTTIATVQSNANALLTIGQAATSATGALSPAVDVTKTFVAFTRRCGTSTTGIERYYQTQGELTNTTTLTFTRAFQNNTSFTQVDIFWYAVSMTDGSTVQRGTATPGGTGNNANAALSPAIVPSRSLPIITVSGDLASASNGDLDDTSWTACFGTGVNCGTASTTNLRFDRANASTNANIAWFVVQFANQVSLVDRREGYP